jgi:hypothetical protein
MMLVLGVVFTIGLVVKEAIILGGFNQVEGRPFPNPSFGGVVQKVQGGVRCTRRHGTHEQCKSDLLVSTLDIDEWWVATPSSCVINF